MTEAHGGREVLADALPGASFGEAASCAEALSQLEEGCWQLVLLDLNMPGRGGLDLLAEVRRLWPRLLVLVVSSSAEEEFALRCLRLGAQGYVTKTAGAKEFIAAVRKVLDGGKHVTPAVAERLAAAAGGDLRYSPHDLLSSRELQVLRLVAKGRNLKEIADELCLSERTVATYRARLGTKLGLCSNVEIARYAMQHKLVE